MANPASKKASVETEEELPQVTEESVASLSEEVSTIRPHQQVLL